MPSGQTVHEAVLLAAENCPGSQALHARFVDGVHVEWGMCPSPQRHMHVGKEGYPTRVFNVFGGPNREIHNVAGSFHGARDVSRRLFYLHHNPAWYFKEISIPALKRQAALETRRAQAAPAPPKRARSSSSTMRQADIRGFLIPQQNPG